MSSVLALTHPFPPSLCHPPLVRPDFHPLVDSITYSDYYLLANDFVDYINTQVRCSATAGLAMVHLGFPHRVWACRWWRCSTPAQRRMALLPFPRCLQDRVDAVYRDQAKWTHMSIMSTAGSGFFSSDRTIAEVRWQQ